MKTLMERSEEADSFHRGVAKYGGNPDRQRWFFELTEQAGGGMALRAMAICNGTLYKSKEQRLGRNREQLAAALCLHSLAARLVTLMYNQREKAFEVIRQRGGVTGNYMSALSNIWRWLDRYGKCVDWNSENVKARWYDFACSLRGIICDLDEIRPAKVSLFYDNYYGKFDVVYQIALNFNNVDGLPGMIPETMPAQQLRLF